MEIMSRQLRPGSSCCNSNSIFNNNYVPLLRPTPAPSPSVRVAVRWQSLVDLWLPRLCLTLQAMISNPISIMRQSAICECLTFAVVVVVHCFRIWVGLGLVAHLQYKQRAPSRFAPLCWIRRHRFNTTKAALSANGDKVTFVIVI